MAYQASTGDIGTVIDETGVHRIPVVPTLLVGPGSGATSATAGYAKAANWTPKGDQQIAIATLVAATALTIPSGATVAFLQNNTSQPLRWRDNGGTPTAAIGQRLLAGGTLTYDGDLSGFKIIYEASGTGTLDIVYYA